MMALAVIRVRSLFLLLAQPELERLGAFCWDITGIGLWWNDRFIGAQNRFRRNFSFR
jgi:hypothetical protein